MDVFSGLAENLHKRVCRFLIHRYLSDFLKSKINLDQMSVNLIDGMATVSEVDMDVQRLNEALESSKVPLTVIEGYIGEVHASAPWKNLLKESCQIEIKRLQITLQPQHTAAHDAQSDPVSSMIGSVVGSLASSMELAQSFLKEETQNDVEDKGVEQFAEVIEAVVSRFRLLFTDTTIRIENPPDSESGLCTAIELQIDWIEFIDEQLESCSAQGTSVEAITSQPHSLSAVPDLNKLFHLRGIRLYTDVFSVPEKDRLEDEFLSASQVITSMYIRREKEKTKRKSSSPGLGDESHSAGDCTPVDSLLQSSISNYQSCYSRVTGLDQSRFSAALSPSTLSPTGERCSYSRERLESNPILFAQFSGEKQTVLIRVRNNNISSQDAALPTNEISLFFGGLHVFLTPSQLYILNSIVGRIILPAPASDGGICNYGKPMKAEDYEEVESQLQARISASATRSTDFQHGNWGGSMTFFEAQRKPSRSNASSASQMADVMLNTNSSLRSYSMHSARKDSTSSEPPGGKAPILSDTAAIQTVVKAKLANFVLLLTHSDDLSQMNVQSRTMSGRETVCKLVKLLEATADHFFAAASSCSFSAQTRLSEIRRDCDCLYSGDHLRFLGASIVFDCSLRKCNDEDAVAINFVAANADFLEVLTPSSVLNSGGTDPTHISLINFPPSEEYGSDRPPHFRLSFDNQRRGQHYNVQVELAECESELDMSLVDRISSFLVTKPFFTYPLSSNELGRYPCGRSLDLKADIFGAASVEQAQSTTSSYSFTLKCPSWKINFRIPMADLRDTLSASARPPYWIRRVHEETLQLTFTEARLEIPTFDASQISQHGKILLSASCLYGSFLGSTSVLQCSTDDMAFLFAGGSKIDGKNRVCLKLSYDSRNISLKAGNAQSSTPDDMQKSMWSSFFKTNMKVEGPFSHKTTLHENDTITRVGTCEELMEFSEGCLKNSNVIFEMTVPLLRLFLPSHEFYEVLYNRLVNDLVLWEPSSPLLKQTTGLQSGVCINAPFGENAFQMCRSLATRKDSDNDDSSESGSQENSRRNSSVGTSHPNETPHKISLLVNVGEGKALIGAKMTENKLLKGESHVAAELTKTQLFVVNGYHGDPELTYFYITSKTFYMFHKNLLDGVSRYESSVREKNFARRGKEDVRAEPVPEGDTLCRLVDDDNFAVALRIQYNIAENIKNILLATAVRNSVVHILPFRDSGHFWVNQLVDFFNVVDYMIPGYEMPDITMRLHVNLSSSQFAYAHSWVTPGSPVKLRLVLDSADVNSRIVPNLEVYRFECIFEDTKLFCAARKPPPVSVQFERVMSRGGAAAPNRNRFVEILSMGHFQLEVKAADNFALASSKEIRCPLIEVKCKNDLVKVWVCADTLVVLANVIVEIANSDAFKPIPESQEEDFGVQSSSCSTSFNAERLKDPRGSVDSAGHPSLESRINRLQEMVESAMTASPSRYMHSEGVAFGENAVEDNELDSYKKGLISDAINDLQDIPTSSHHRTVSTGTDEGFCVVDEILGSGITSASGEPRVRNVNESSDGSFVVVSDDHFQIPDERISDDLLRLPSDYPCPLIRYQVRDISLLLHLYGGSDYADEKPSPKSYSSEEFRAGKGPGQRIDPEAVGGVNRDYSVHVEIFLSKMCFLYQLFGINAPILSLNLFTIHGVEVRDKLSISQIDKMLYQYASDQLPRRTCAPMIAIRMLETHQNEGKMKISLLPIRLNLDQDTMEFLQNFISDVSTNVDLPNAVNTVNFSDQPILEVPAEVNRHVYPLIPMPAEATVRYTAQTPLELGDLSQFLNTPESASSSKASPDGGGDRKAPSAASVENLFNENDLNLLVDPTEITASFYGHHQQPASRFAYVPNSMAFHEELDVEDDDQKKSTELLVDVREEPPTVDDILNEITVPEADLPEPLASQPDVQDDQETCQEDDGSSTMVNSAGAASPAPAFRRETFFKEFSFSPAVTIRLDYQGKRVKKGALFELLMGLSNLHCTELQLKELHNRNGLLGHGRCVQFAVNEWINDIRNNQLARVIGSYGPISSLFQLGQGIRDLFLMPVDEYRKDDGHIVKGLQKGAESFGVSTAAAAVDIAQRVVGMVQGIAEMAFDIVTPDYPACRNRRRLALKPSYGPPNDIREGFHLAYEAVREGVSDTARVLQLAAQEDRAAGHWPLRGLLRQATPTVIRPIVVASKATFHVLGGLKSQLKPDSYREEMDKWKHEDAVDGYYRS